MLTVRAGWLRNTASILNELGSMEGSMGFITLMGMFTPLDAFAAGQP